MALRVDAVTSLVEGLKIADKTSEVDGKVHGHSISTLQDAIQLLDQFTKIAFSQAQQARVLASSTNHHNRLDITEIYSLCKKANEITEVTHILENTANTLRDAAELSIITYLTSLGGQGGADLREGSLLQHMLLHFDKQIRSIVRGVLSNCGHGSRTLWKIVEECYQETSFSGALYPGEYFIESDEACLEYPYDPDYEADKYYEHEDRLAIDDDYAKAMGERTARRRDERERKEQSWIDFWVLVLHVCPNGPTLFYPPASDEVNLQVLATTDIPQYLFRTFDSKSSGTNNDNIVASIASVTESPEESRTDLLSLPKDEAIGMLYTHLNKQCCGGEDSDNLMSWTSSLLFAIQYAIWRRHTFGCHPADIKICVVDTRRFPQGQFAPDMWLLQAYRNTAAKVGGKTEEFFRFRLEYTRYHNGEYLSQGSVDHVSRSCVVTLESLEKSGLYDLYPEFAEVEGTKRWTNRVRELREGWSVEQRTTPREIQLASVVARRCFNTFETLNMMLILLTFKARKIKGKGLLYNNNFYFR